ncbi:MAG: cell division protein FtsK [Actinomycetia bacterium]|nr:cell division protein FtsK [Actinomycetes bacterium]MCH9733114.1 cell division protein FtsK [Actinomycetes bacterium]
MSKVFLGFALFIGWLLTAPVPGLSVVYVLAVIAGFFLLRQKSQIPEVPVQPSPYLPEVQRAVGRLECAAQRSDVLNAVRLCGMSGAGNAIRAVPSLIRLEPTPFGARAYLHGLMGQELADWQRASGRLASALGVKVVRVGEPNPGVFQLDLRVADPLSRPMTAREVTASADWSLPLGLDETGQVRRLAISNVSGVVLGGLPGSGKTAWLTSSLASFAACDAVQYLVIDGKGGMDLSAIESRSYRFLNDDMDLDSVLVALREVRELVRDRMRNLHHLLGTSNFWNHGPTRELPLVFVVIDECQTFLDPRQLISKELKMKGAEIHGLVSHLVRKGRSAGVVTILATQKPTADSLPTDIRDNSTLRICFGVQSSYAAAAVLGDEWSADSGASPLGAPVGVGVAAACNSFFRFRSPYVPEEVVADYGSKYAHSREHPAVLFSLAMADGS